MLQGRPPLYLAIAVHLLCWTLGNPLCGQTPPQSLEIRALGAEARVGRPLRVSVRALATDGTPSDSWQSNVTLRVLVPVGALPVLSEINTVAGTIEVTNPGDADVDVSGWELQAWSPQIFIDNANSWIRIPEGSLMPGRSVFTWTPTASTPSLFPNLTGGRAFSATASPLALVRLMDASGNTIDQVWVGSPDRFLAGMDTRGPVLQAPSFGASLLREGSGNHGSRQDWTNRAPSLGITNSNLRLPWMPVQAIDLATVQLVHGAWTGEIIVPAADAAALTLQADDGAGLIGNSGPIPLLGLPQLTLTIPPGAMQASETSAGPLGEAVVSISTPLTTPLVVYLSLDATGEFTLPSSVTILPGNTSAWVPISNLNDGVPDGDALVTLTATATGFAPATATLLNRDGHPTGLSVVAPDGMRENIGFSVLGGELLLPFVATHAVLVRLAAEPPLEVPAEALIRAGTRSTSFWIRSGDNSVANAPPFTALISATTGSGSPAETRVSIIDDESSLYTISFPKSLLEGTTTNGHIHLAVPHAAGLRVLLSSDIPRLSVPPTVVVPAGVVDLDFAVTAPNDTATNGVGLATVTYVFDNAAPQFAGIKLLDDEIRADTISFLPGASCFLSSIPVSGLSSIRSLLGEVQQYNGLGTLGLGDRAKASVAPLQPIQFTNGIWSGNLVFSGEGLSLPLTLSAAGTNSTPQRVDVLQGSLLSRPVLDLACTPGSSKILALAPPTNTTPALLMEVDATTGATNRVLALPRRANRIALSDDGAVAWLASSTGTLQRVDVAAWQFDREVGLSSLAASPRPLDVIVLPGSRDRVVVIVAGVGSTTNKIALLDGGTLVGKTVPLSGSSFNISLLPGRNDTEAFSQTYSSLSRYTLGAEGVTLAATTNLLDSSNICPNLSLSGNRLYHGNGAVFQADDLSRVQAEFLPDGLALANDARQIELFLVAQTTDVQVRAFDSWATLPGHGLPYRPAKGSRVVRWGSRGLAYIAETSAKLVMLESPLLDAEQPGLELHLEPLAPVQLGNYQQRYAAINLQLSYVISNSGPVVARGNTLQGASTADQPIRIPDLAPGESTRVDLKLSPYSPGIIKLHAAVVSVSGNSSSNAVVETAIRVHGPALAGAQELVIGAAALAGNPAGDRLFASISRFAGDIRDGVAIIDPETGAELSFLATAGSPGKLLTSDDGSLLYAAVGTNGLLRWNLATGSNDVSIVIPNDSILDFQPLAGHPRSVVVSTTKKVALYSDDSLLPLTLSAVASDSRLAYSGTNLWSYTPSRLRRLAAKTNGLATISTAGAVPPSQGFRFLVGDGRYLFASGQPLNTDTMTIADAYPEAFGLVVDSPSGELLGTFSGSLRHFARDTFTTIESEPLTPSSVALYSPTLWGADGIAVRSSDQRVFLVHSVLRHRGKEVDLALSIAPPVQPVAGAPSIWRISVTNRSATASGPVRLAVRTVGSPVSPIEFEGVAMTGLLDEFVGIIPSVPAGSSAVVLLHAMPLNGQSHVEASMVSSNPDPSPGDHFAASDITADYPDGDLVLITLPPAGPRWRWAERSALDCPSRTPDRQPSNRATWAFKEEAPGCP